MNDRSPGMTPSPTLIAALYFLKNSAISKWFITDQLAYQKIKLCGERVVFVIKNQAIKKEEFNLRAKYKY